MRTPLVISLVALFASPTLAAPEAPVPAAAAPSASPAPTTVKAARRALLGPGRKATLRPTTLIEQAVVDGLIPLLVERARAGRVEVADLALIAAPAAFVVERWAVEGADYLVLRERPGEARGAGAYVFRVGEATRSEGAEVLLQAPHAYFDLHTGRIAVAAMFDPKGPHPRALFVNTVQRYQRGAPDPHSAADVCHRPEHLFTWATDRALGAMGAALVVQLHGFDEGGIPPGTRAIVSGGMPRAPSASLIAIADRLGPIIGDGVRLYYRDVRLLGGTTNVQGRLCEVRDGVRFVHLELARAVRERLRKSGKERRALTRALFGAATPTDTAP